MMKSSFFFFLLLTSAMIVLMLSSSSSTTTINASSLLRQRNPLVGSNTAPYNCSNSNPQFPPITCSSQQSCCQAYGVNHESLCIANLETNYCCQHIGAVANCARGQDCCGWGDDDGVSEAFCCPAGGVCSGSEWGSCCKPGQISCSNEGYGACCDRATSTCSPNGGCEKINSLTTIAPDPNNNNPGTLLWQNLDSPSIAPITSNVANVTLVGGKTTLFLLPGAKAVHAIDSSTGKTRFVTYVGGDSNRGPPSVSNSARSIDEIYTNQFAAPETPASNLVAFIAANYDSNQTFGFLNYNSQSDDNILLFQVSLSELVSQVSTNGHVLRNARITTSSSTGGRYASAAGIFARNRFYLQFTGMLYIKDKPHTEEQASYLVAFDVASKAQVFLIKLPVEYGSAIFDDKTGALYMISLGIDRVWAIDAATGQQLWGGSSTLLPKEASPKTAVANAVLTFSIKTAMTPYNSPTKGKSTLQLLIATSLCVAAIEASTGTLIWATTVNKTLGYPLENSPIINAADVLWEVELVVFSVQLLSPTSGSSGSSSSSYVYYLYLPLGRPEGNSKKPDDVTPPCQTDSVYADPRFSQNQQIISLGDIGDGSLGFPAFAVACLSQPSSSSSSSNQKMNKNKNLDNNKIGSYIYASTQIRVTSFERMWVAKYSNQTIVSNYVYATKQKTSSSSSSSSPIIIFVRRTISPALVNEDLVILNSVTGVLEYSVQLTSRLNNNNNNNGVGSAYQLDFVSDDIVVASSSDKRLFGIKI